MLAIGHVCRLALCGVLDKNESHCATLRPILMRLLVELGGVWADLG